VSARYEPERVVQADGQVVDYYAAAHAAREADARAALDEISWSALVVTRICCAHGRHGRLILGRVYKTLQGHVVVLNQRPRIPRPLVDLMRDRPDLRNQQPELLDILDAPADRDLEASACRRCPPPQVVDRARLSEAVRAGHRNFLV
jgi:hypothetical protein